MTTLGTLMVRNDWTVTIAELDVDGTPGKIVAKTQKGFNMDVAFYLRLRGEKQVKLGTLSDNCRIANVRDILGDWIETEFVTHWNPSMTWEPHVECMI